MDYGRDRERDWEWEQGEREGENQSYRGAGAEDDQTRAEPRRRGWSRSARGGGAEGRPEHFGPQHFGGEAGEEYGGFRPQRPESPGWRGGRERGWGGRGPVRRPGTQGFAPEHEGFEPGEFSSGYGGREGGYGEGSLGSEYEGDFGRGAYGGGEYPTGYGEGGYGVGSFGGGYGPGSRQAFHRQGGYGPIGYGQGPYGQRQFGQSGYARRGFGPGGYGSPGWEAGFYGPAYGRGSRGQWGPPSYEGAWSETERSYRRQGQGLTADEWSGSESWAVPGPYSGVGPQGYQRSDDRIREDVCERLTRHGALDASGIRVNVEQGEVTLEGNVDSRHAKRIAEDVVETLPGVRDVQNRLRVSERGRAGGWESRPPSVQSEGETERGRTTEER